MFLKAYTFILLLFNLMVDITSVQKLTTYLCEQQLNTQHGNTVEKQYKQ